MLYGYGLYGYCVSCVSCAAIVVCLHEQKATVLAKKCHSQKFFAPAARKKRPKKNSPAFGRHPSDPHLARS